MVLGAVRVPEGRGKSGGSLLYVVLNPGTGFTVWLMVSSLPPESLYAHSLVFDRSAFPSQAQQRSPQ